jgi:hypothetical protein
VGELVLAALTLRPEAEPQITPWPREAEADALLARRDRLEARWRRGDLGDEVFFRNSAALEELLQGLQAERRRWDADQAILGDRAETRHRRWLLEPDAGGYDLAQKRSIIALALETVLVFPAGKGRRRQSNDSYLPVLKML